MAAVAEGFVFRMPTTAKADYGAATQVKGVPLRVVETELTFHAQRAIVSYMYFCLGQVHPP
jgi:hypothetical protein